jgi:hypothetical protein
MASMATAMVTVARAEYPIVDKVAEKVIQKYQTSSCEQLAAERTQKMGKPKSPAEQKAIEALHQNAGARAEFFNRISAPVVNKLFECGMIP